MGIAASRGWVQREDENQVPDAEGWYRVLHSGDEERDGPHVYYSFDDYQGWGYWTPAAPEELEDWDGGWKGSWSCEHDEEGDISIMAWFGPITIPPIGG